MPRKKTSAAARSDGPTAPPAYLSLAGAAEDAVRTMGCAILDLGKLDDSAGLNDVRVALDAASRALWAAVKAHRGWERTVHASAARLTLSIDLGPIAATCAACGDQALILPAPTGPGVAICRRCSFQDRTA